MNVSINTLSQSEQDIFWDFWGNDNKQRYYGRKNGKKFCDLCHRELPTTFMKEICYSCSVHPKCALCSEKVFSGVIESPMSFTGSYYVRLPRFCSEHLSSEISENMRTRMFRTYADAQKYEKEIQAKRSILSSQWSIWRNGLEKLAHERYPNTQHFVSSTVWTFYDNSSRAVEQWYLK